MSGAKTPNPSTDQDFLSLSHIGTQSRNDYDLDKAKKYAAYAPSGKDIYGPDGKTPFTADTFCNYNVDSSTRLRKTLLDKLKSMVGTSVATNPQITTLETNIPKLRKQIKDLKNLDTDDEIKVGEDVIKSFEVAIPKSVDFLDKDGGTKYTADTATKALAEYKSKLTAANLLLSQKEREYYQLKQSQWCFKSEWCKEDATLKSLRARFQDIINRQYTQNPNCNMSMPDCLRNFDDDRQINYFKSKIGVLRDLSFNFLHRICDNVVQNCDNKNLADRIPVELIDCSGINKQTGIFFGDRDLAAIGRQISPASQRNGNSPAARGFSPCLYPIGTLARGSDGLYVNACTPSRDPCNLTTSKTCVRWIRANLMEVAAYKTAQELRQRITQRKRQIITYAKEVIRLQAKMYSLHPMQAVYQQRRVRDPMCVPVANASQVVDLGLKRLKANMMNKVCQDEINEVRQTLRDQSSLMCRPQRRRSSKKKKKNNNKTKKKK